jgi:AraC-like DNA-binding protein
MATSFVGAFSEPDQAAAAFKAGRAQVTITQSGKYCANLVGADFGRLSLMHGEDNLAKVTHLDLVPNRVAFSFLPGISSGVFADGREVRRNQVNQHSVGRSYYQTTLGPAPWGAILLPPAEIAGITEIFGSAQRSLRQSHAIMPSAQAMQRLIRLHIMAVRLVRDAPEMLQRPEAVRGLEHAVIEALAGCLAGDETPEETAGQRSHATVMRRFHRLLADKPTDTLFLADVCAATGVSARTLRACCEAHIGMGPKHFLTLRRMHLARHALQGAGASNVTDVATQFGFWELGRFAVTYKELFGEVPSATLRRAARDSADVPVAGAEATHSWVGPLWAAALGWAHTHDGILSMARGVARDAALGNPA